uniref:Uncharacterized protein LOC112829897 n=1 Tax=Callorhinus ursinus TaxID=34884 RepID=A0A3Q7PNR5_CALUR|nr:uncharacterized protein LOC112829897 [Callorhinus ursinus]XP_025735368.1 uncharacterized protein LOC112829947 [Callorhinus ursinus]
MLPVSVFCDLNEGHGGRPSHCPFRKRRRLSCKKVTSPGPGTSHVTPSNCCNRPKPSRGAAQTCHFAGEKVRNSARGDVICPKSATSWNWKPIGRLPRRCSFRCAQVTQRLGTRFLKRKGEAGPGAPLKEMFFGLGYFPRSGITGLKSKRIVKSLDSESLQQGQTSSLKLSIPPGQSRPSQPWVKGFYSFWALLASPSHTSTHVSHSALAALNFSCRPPHLPFPTLSLPSCLEQQSAVHFTGLSSDGMTGSL